MVVVRTSSAWPARPAAFLTAPADRVEPASAWVLLAALVAIFGLSGGALAAMGWPYATPGGQALFKIHPATYLLVISIGLTLISPLRRAQLFHVLSANPAFPAFLAAQAFILVYAAVVLDAPASIFTDAWIAPGLFVVLIYVQSEPWRRRAGIVLHTLLFLNSALGIAEATLGFNLFPPQIMAPQVGLNMEITALQDGRGVGLLGHPLLSSMASGLLAVAMFSQMAFRGVTLLRLFALSHALLALPSFGGRTALLLACIFIAMIFLSRAVAFAFGRRIHLRDLMVAFLVLCAGGALMLLAFQLGYFERLIDRFENDHGSAHSRLIALDIFGATHWPGLVWGDVNHEIMVRALKRGSWAGIEISYIGYILHYGLICAVPAFATLLALLLTLVRRCGGLALWCVAYFLLIIASNTSISTKTADLAVFVCLVLLFFRPSQADPSREAPHV